MRVYIGAGFLGPLFFILFVNDLPLCLQFSLAFIYAGDTKC